MLRILIGIAVISICVAIYFATHQRSVIVNLIPVGNDIGGVSDPK